MSFQEDWTAKPLDFVTKIFDECNGTGDWREKIVQFFQKCTSETISLKKIPWLNETPLQDLKNHQVVRFRGLIQDMNDNEFFLDTYEVRNKITNETTSKPGRYLDIATCAPNEEILIDSGRCETGDRLSYYCVSIPGETPWVQQIYKENNPYPSIPSTSCSQQLKRHVDEEEDEESNSIKENINRMEVDTSDNKRLCGKNDHESLKMSNKATSSQSTQSIDLNFPLPNAKDTACLIKLYNNENYSLNDLVEVVGILSVDPMMVTNGDEGSDNGFNSPSPPPSLVPRLHVLSIKNLDHCSPLLPSPINEHCRSSFAAVEAPEDTRELLHQILTDALLGDSLGADLLICHLISSVYMRQDIKPMGKYCLNISGINKTLVYQDFSSKLYGLIEKLVTQSYFLPMTLDNMNSYKFIPEKDYTTNRLTSGILQLGAHTHLVLDETALSNGQLDAYGVRNLTSLGNLINWQKVDYDFKYHNIEQHANIPVLIFSEAKAMIASDSEFKIQPLHYNITNTFNKIDAQLTTDTLKRLRIFITAARMSEFTLNDHMQEVVQEDFVESRKNDNGMSGNDLHELLILSRLISKTCGESTLTSDVWKRTKVLNTERKARLTDFST